MEYGDVCCVAWAGLDTLCWLRVVYVAFVCTAECDALLEVAEHIDRVSFKKRNPAIKRRTHDSM
jgi:hypothetical protein